MSTLTYKGGEIQVRFPYNPQAIRQIKTLPDAKWNKAHKFWSLPASPWIAGQAMQMFPCAEVDGVTRRLAKLHPILKVMCKSTVPQNEPINDLRPYQMAGVEYIEACNGRAFLADSTGTGKTPISLTWAKIRKLKRILIVCPSTTQYKWCDEVKRWFNKKSTPLIVKSNSIPPDADVLVMTYARLRMSHEVLLDMDFDLMILDECVAIKNHRSQQGRAARLVAKKCKYVLGLSATPIPNRVSELFNQLTTIRPWEYKSLWKFKNRYEYSNVRHPELRERLADIMIRRRKADVLDQLPELTRIIEWIDLPHESRMMYVRTQAEIKAALRELSPNHKGYFVNALDRITALRLAVGQAKGELAGEFAVSFTENNDSGLIVACNFMNTIKAVAAKLIREKIPHQIITGKDSIESREDKIRRFRRQQDRVLVMSAVGQEGIDLFGLEKHRVSDIVIIDKPWTPSAEDQIEGRLHRMGQDFPVTATHLLAKNTVDVHMHYIVESKRHLGENIARQGELVKELVRRILDEKE